MKWVLGLFFSALSLFALEKQDEEAIEKIVKGYVRAWNEADSQKFVENFGENASFINIFGDVFQGKDKIEERHRYILGTFLKGSTFKVLDFKVSELSRDVAVALVFWEVAGFLPSNATKRGVFSHTLVNEKEGWKILFTQNTLIQPKT